MEKPMPQLLAMVICDTIIQDVKTAKKSLIGIFNNIYVAETPARYSSMSVYITVTEGFGQCAGSLVLKKEDDDTTICTIDGMIDFKDRHSRIELIYDFNGVVFPEFGKYRFDFLCDNKLVKSRKFSVNKPKKK